MSSIFQILCKLKQLNLAKPFFQGFRFSCHTAVITWIVPYIKEYNTLINLKPVCISLSQYNLSMLAWLTLRRRLFISRMGEWRQFETVFLNAVK